MGTPVPGDYNLTTMVDREITGQMHEQVGRIDAIRAARQTGAPAELTRQLLSGGAEPETPGSISYGELMSRHPEYVSEYWRECRALYAGGPRLFLDEEVLKRLFPQNAFEAPDVYANRKARSFYVAYPGEIIDNLIAGFAADPIRLSSGTDDKGDESPLPEWWSKFAEDVSAPGGEKLPIGTFAVEWLREAFQTRTAWALVDLPRRDPNAPAPESLLAEEQSGARSPYVCMLPAENVLDWEEDEETRELSWVLCYWRSRPRTSLRASRSLVTERWIEWTATGWRSYRCTWDPKQPPRPEDRVALDAEGEHAFGQVPIVRLTLPEGMYAMGKMHSIAREHFNKRNALSWAEFKSLFAQLYEFNGSEEGSSFDPKMNPALAQTDPGRSTNQVRGQGYAQVRGADDRAEYIGPPTDGFQTALESCAELMRELHRVMFSMALSANMDSAAIKRSGDSKERDAASTAVVLAKSGEIVREGVRRMLDLVARGRGEAKANVEATGGSKFDAASVAASITEAVEFLNGVPQRSPTFLKHYLYKIYKLVAGPEIPQKELETILEELGTAITAETLIMSDPSADPSKMIPEDDDGEEAGDEDDDEDEPAPRPKPTPKAKPAAGKQRVYP